MKEFNLEITDYKTVRDAVFDTIRKGILNGYFKPGERIIESQLAERMNVSRTPVREALRRLEVEKLVENLPRKGMIVTTLNDSQIFEIFNIRSALEGLAINLAIDNSDDELFNNLQDCINNMKDAINTGDIKKQIDYNTKFHDYILIKTYSPMLVDMLNNIKGQIQLYRYHSLSLIGRPEISYNEHEHILNFIKNKDKENAEKYIKIHIKNAGISLVNSHKNRDV